MGCCNSAEEKEEHFETTFALPYATVFLDVWKNEQELGRIEIQLFADVPKTAENFRVLCTGEKDSLLSYKGCPFHKIVPGLLIQSGDITKQNGNGGISIYGRTFSDENFNHEHKEPGLLSMANTGKDTNNSQFFITTVKAPWLNRKNVVFGRVSDGMSVVKKVESYGQQRIDKSIIIKDCGQIGQTNKKEGRKSRRQSRPSFLFIEDNRGTSNARVSFAGSAGRSLVGSGRRSFCANGRKSISASGTGTSIVTVHTNVTAQSSASQGARSQHSTK